MNPARSTVSTETSLQNSALILACQAGDQRAWNVIVERYERLVYAVALGEGLSADQAADVAQETFGALVSSLDRLAKPDRLGSWLMTVARRFSWRVRDGYRRHQVPIDESTQITDDLAPDLAHALWVYEAVEQLDDPCRAQVRALFFDPNEPSYSEVAVRLGRPLGSIGPLRGRCLVRLRSILEATK